MGVCFSGICNICNRHGFNLLKSDNKYYHKSCFITKNKEINKIKYPYFLFFILQIFGEKDFVNKAKIKINRINKANEVYYDTYM